MRGYDAGRPGGRDADDAGVAAVAAELRAGRDVPDDDFDAIYPPELRRRSASYWTPVAVAQRASALLAADGPVRVLDVGAGIGKLCLVGALTSGSTFTGIERRPHFVAAATEAARALGVRQARFVLGTLEDVVWSEHDAFYFFNPFEENLLHEDERLDRAVPFSDARFDCDVALAEAALDEAPVGTRVVTYHGFGGRMPLAYRLERSERWPTGSLRLWVKVVAGRSALDDDRYEALLKE